MENVIMMFNHAGFSDNVYLSFRILPQAAIFTMRYFYGILNVTYMTQIFPFVITSPLHNKHNSDS